MTKKEILAAKEAFGDPRRTKVWSHKVGEISEADLIPDEEVIITLTTSGYIKRIDPKEYKIQKRGGKGIIGLKTVGDDIVEQAMVANTHDRILFFTDSGRAFQTLAYEIPEGARVAIHYQRSETDARGTAEECGGAGVTSHVTDCIVQEEMFWGCAGMATSMGAIMLGALPILLAGTDEQKKKYLTMLTQKRNDGNPMLGAYALTEPEAGSDAAASRTSATPAALTMYQGHGPRSLSRVQFPGGRRRNM